MEPPRPENDLSIGSEKEAEIDDGTFPKSAVLICETDRDPNRKVVVLEN